VPTITLCDTVFFDSAVNGPTSRMQPCSAGLLGVTGGRRPSRAISPNMAGEPPTTNGSRNDSLAQTLTLIGPGGDEPSAYATNAYRHQASPCIGVNA
jgi:hypothetical protein